MSATAHDVERHVEPGRDVRVAWDEAPGAETESERPNERCDPKPTQVARPFPGRAAIPPAAARRRPLRGPSAERARSLPTLRTKRSHGGNASCKTRTLVGSVRTAEGRLGDRSGRRRYLPMTGSTKTARFGAGVTVGVVAAVTALTFLSSQQVAFARTTRTAVVGRIESPLGL